MGRYGSILQLAATPVPGFTDLRTGSVQTLSGVFGNAPDDMWAVGAAGTVLRFDGQRGQRGGGADQRRPAGRVGQRPE